MLNVSYKQILIISRSSSLNEFYVEIINYVRGIYSIHIYFFLFCLFILQRRCENPIDVHRMTQQAHSYTHIQ